MASDIKIKFDELTQEFDFKYNNGDLLREEGLETAVLISLFTDRRANDDDELINPGEYRGWWGDELSEDDQIGSRLWLVKQKATQRNVILAKEYIIEALQWMIDDGVVSKIDVETEAQGPPENKRLAAKLRIYYTDGNVEAIEFKNLWEKQISAIS
jgi:phage gp46-like protein